MEVYVMLQLRQINGVIQLLDVYKSPEGYVLVIDQPSAFLTDLNDYAKKFCARQGRMEEAQALRVIKQLIPILKDIHLAGVYHQDIKCKNILIDRLTQQIYVIDFGAAMLVTSKPFRYYHGE